MVGTCRVWASWQNDSGWTILLVSLDVDTYIFHPGWSNSPEHDLLVSGCSSLEEDRERAGSVSTSRVLHLLLSLWPLGLVSSPEKKYFQPFSGGRDRMKLCRMYEKNLRIQLFLNSFSQFFKNMGMEHNCIVLSFFFIMMLFHSFSMLLLLLIQQ